MPQDRSTAAPRQIAEASFYALSILYWELLLRVCGGDTLLSFSALYILAFSSAGALLLSLLFLLPLRPKAHEFFVHMILWLTGVVYCVEYFLRISFQTYMGPSSIQFAAGDVAVSFRSTIAALILRSLGIIALFVLPMILHRLLWKTRIRTPQPGLRLRTLGKTLLAAALLWGVGTGLTALHGDFTKFWKEPNFNVDVKTYGLASAIGKDFVQMLPGGTSFEPVDSAAEADESAAESLLRAGRNEMDLTFPSSPESSASDTGDDDTIAALNAYVQEQTASSKNANTGLFSGKNLIFISAESFSKEVISEDLTPALYRMATKGIVFSDYYQPSWGGSTTTGEYANILGLIPTAGVSSMTDTVGHNLYLTLGNQLRRLGYTSAAFHDGDSTYYSRDITHPNCGYDTFTAMGSGLEASVTQQWPESDLQMFEATIPEYIGQQPFSLYYMTVSGHCIYTQEKNAMSRKNYDAVKNLPYSETIKCYLAANLELEYAMEYLLSALEEAGIADDTVIVLTADHYPYGLENSMTWGNDQDYLSELYGYTPENNAQRDHNALLIWSGSLEDSEPIEVDTPTSSLDILPTVSNLFGLTFDSRLLVGRDVFSEKEPLVLWPDYSWKTTAGYYDAESGTFTPADGKPTVDDSYIESIKADVRNRFAFSRGVLETDYYGALFGPVK